MPSLPWAYPALMGAALATGVTLARRQGPALGLTSRQKALLGLGAFTGSMLAAKLPYVLASGLPWWALAAWHTPGKTILSGLAGGYLGVEAAKRLLGVTAKTGDWFAVPVAAAVAVGRLACFVGPCCWGRPTTLPWGVDFGDGIARHPTQLYEAAFHAAAALVLWRLRAAGALRLQLMKAYILCYAGYRFLTEFVRPEDRIFLGLTAYQLGALALIAIFSGLWLRDGEAYA